MKYLENQNAKSPYMYTRYHVNEIDEVILRHVILRNETLTKDKRRKSSRNKSLKRVESKRVGSRFNARFYLNINMSFDIETYTNQETQKANMYTWQFGLNDTVIIGRTWSEFLQLLDKLKEFINPGERQRCICWIHNASYEFAWMHKWINIDDPEKNFFKDRRHVIYFTHDGWLEFRDSMSMTNSSLKKLAQDYTNTQKCVGDLDYTKPLSSEDKLTEKERGYCDNDVLILTEWAQYFFNTYLTKNYCPLTITGVLNSEVNAACWEWLKEVGVNKEWWLWELQKYKPESEALYNVIMNWLYRGGYTHSNQFYVDIVFTFLSNIYGFDFTSSYPAVMLLCYYPGKWEQISVETEEELREICEEKCCYFRITLYDVKSTTDHSIESQSKCINLVNPKIDNGRVRSCDSMTVWLTELDYQTYEEFYSWDETRSEIKAVHVAPRIQLFPYLLKTMLHYYTEKDRLKKEGLPYAVEKAKVNTFYGLTVKRFNNEMTRYSEETGWYEEAGKGWEEQNYSTVLPCFIGVYISAHARRNLLKVTYQLEQVDQHVIYHDTDSIKIIDFNEDGRRIIDAYNRDIEQRLHQRCKEIGIDFSSVDDLGMWDEEYGEQHPVVAFKTMGAKRYLISYLSKNKFKSSSRRIRTLSPGYNINHNQTIAGLPKGILFKGRTEDWEEVYDEFEDDMIVNDCKLRPVYIEEATDVMVNGVNHHELSSIALVNNTFSMSLDDMWIQEFKEYQEYYQNMEHRIM